MVGKIFLRKVAAIGLAKGDDPIGDQRVSEEGFAAMCGRVVAWAEATAEGRVVLVLEGGYDLDGLARSVTACARVLAGETAPAAAAPSPRGERAIASAIAAREAALRG
jgi:acetoin utilization deacetylase AcuC-like enzyme